MSIELQRLKWLDIRIQGISIHHKDSPELARLSAAREDIVSRLSPEDTIEYHKVNTISEEEKQKQIREEMAEMEANRDRSGEKGI